MGWIMFKLGKACNWEDIEIGDLYAVVGQAISIEIRVDNTGYTSMYLATTGPYGTTGEKTGSPMNSQIIYKLSEETKELYLTK